ncbi:MAG: exodeoxyribonuclease VII large subunit [Gammaproteobacteria bacterium]|nr:exodeoxyribonuclease VII large subunit [Gammaproteobacteria bacterium]
MASNPERDIYTVSRLNRAVRELLEGRFGAVWIEGELSNLARPASGHLYFSLKDGNAQVRCAMFRSRQSGLGFAPRDGMHVVAYARVGMYEPRGEFQLVVEHLEPAGEGVLRMRFEALKRKLAAEGLFETETKRPLPAWPVAIGVITSPTGAAVRDILHVLARRNPAIPVVIYPAAVQGAAAVPELVAALQAANARAECDVLILARGGGSLEDLWAFNEEALARAVHASEIPVVSGVGHEIDFTIADLVADVRAPTPSAAAELCSPDAGEALRLFGGFERRLAAAMNARLKTLAAKESELARRLRHPGRRVEELYQRVDELSRRLPQALATQLRLRESRLAILSSRLAAVTPLGFAAVMRERVAAQQMRLGLAMGARLKEAAGRVEATERALRTVSPLATLDRGYAILTDAEGRIARDAAAYRPGDKLEARLARGRLGVVVESKEAPPEG